MKVFVASLCLFWLMAFQLQAQTVKVTPVSDTIRVIMLVGDTTKEEEHVMPIQRSFELNMILDLQDQRPVKSYLLQQLFGYKVIERKNGTYTGCDIYLNADKKRLADNYVVWSTINTK